MSVVFTDSFTVGVDTNLSSYPNWAYNMGSLGDFIVTAANDRLESASTSDLLARITAAGVPTGDQQITATLTSGANYCALAGRVATDGTGNGYIAYCSAAGSNVKFYRIDNTAFVDLTGDNSRTFTSPFTLRFKITGTNPVVLELQAAGTAILTYNDSDANRKQSGVPGVANGGYSAVYWDDVSVDNLATTTPISLGGAALTDDWAS